MKNYMLSIMTICLFTLAQTGSAAPTPKKGEISMEKATAIATEKIKGTIKSSEYEFEKGQNVYSFDIASKDGKIHEILVSARNGEIVSSSIESTSQEAAEEKADRKEK